MVSIADFERGRMLSLMPNKKEAMIFELKGKMSEDKIRKSNFFGNLRTTLEDYRQGDQKVRLEELGEKELDGPASSVFASCRPARCKPCGGTSRRVSRCASNRRTWARPRPKP